MNRASQFCCVTRRVALSVGALAGLSLATGVLGGQAPAGEQSRLLVILMVDQMRADYLDRFGSQWGSGLKRLLERGAIFRRAEYPYLQTATCPGHATVSTGTFPATHGLVLNQWWDRDSRTLVTCTYDPTAPLVSYGKPAKGGDSALRLRVPTLGDELRATFGSSSRVVVFSLKDRSAISLAGRRADVVTWFHEPSHQWVTSQAYAKTPVPFVQSYIRQHAVESEFGKTWARIAPASRYLFEDEAVGERPPPGWTSTFPHPLSGSGLFSKAEPYSLWESSPFSDEYLVSLAITAVDALKLGGGPAPDLLAISFSALDLVGHRFGPRSHEVQDVLARLDATVARLLDALDRRLGPERYVVAFAGDHGVSVIPEQLRTEGLDAGRIVTQDIGDRVEEVLTARFGRGRHVARVVSSDVYFEPGVAAKIEADPGARRAVIQAIQAVPGVERVFLPGELADATDRNSRAVALSYFPGRSGDLIVVPRPRWSFTLRNAPAAAATHGTAHEYDTRVPLILMGSRIKAGNYTQAVTPADIAPTLALVAGVTMERTDGRALAEVITGSPVPGSRVQDPALPVGPGRRSATKD